MACSIGHPTPIRRMTRHLPDRNVTLPPKHGVDKHLFRSPPIHAINIISIIESANGVERRLVRTERQILSHPIVNLQTHTTLQRHPLRRMAQLCSKNGPTDDRKTERKNHHRQKKAELTKAHTRASSSRCLRMMKYSY